MNNIQEIITILVPITLLITTLAKLLDALIKSAELMEKLQSKLQSGFRLLLLTLTQVLPVGSVIWNFMYFAAIYSERLIEKTFFLLIVVYPTLLICSYEMFWGMVFYPKLLSHAKSVELPSKKLKSTRVRNNKKGVNHE